MATVPGNKDTVCCRSAIGDNLAMTRGAFCNNKGSKRGKSGSQSDKAKTRLLPSPRRAGSK